MESLVAIFGMYWLPVSFEFEIITFSALVIFRLPPIFVPASLTSFLVSMFTSLPFVVSKEPFSIKVSFKLILFLFDFSFEFLITKFSTVSFVAYELLVT